MSDVYLEEFLTGHAVWWPVSTTDRDGDYVYDEPVEVKCRWDDVTVEYLDMTGARRISNANVMVDRDMTPGGMLWLGRLKNLVDIAVPKNNGRAYKIERFEKIPDPDIGTEFVRNALM